MELKNFREFIAESKTKKLDEGKLDKESEKVLKELELKKRQLLSDFSANLDPMKFKNFDINSKIIYIDEQLSDLLKDIYKGKYSK